ncbi:MAG: HAD family hydrolase [Ruminococcaceae bacterium]|nr:HAD family hydrolase [Oscillospiraceae bacterium]
MKNCFFDLDGTLTDSAEGIINSVLYALSTYGIEEKDRAALTSFVGPPLGDSFMKRYGFSEEQAEEAIRRFRVRFTSIGIFENALYEGVDGMLASLKEKGVRVILATSKPETFARRILEHFGIARYFDFICGANLEEKSRVEKEDVLLYALETSGADPKESCMIGDRRYDVTAGKKLGLSTVGVLYGYGTREELEESGADLICETVEELKGVLNG